MHKVRKATQVGPTCSSKWIKSRKSPPPLSPFLTLLNPHLTYSTRVFRWLVRTEARLRATSPPTTFSLTHSQVFKFTCNTSHSVRLLFFFIKDHLSVSGYGYGYFFCVYFRYKLCLCYFVSQFPPSSFVLLFFFLSENLL